MSYLNASFQNELQNIREYHFQKNKENLYHLWSFKYKEHLEYLYTVFSKYYFLDYHQFMALVYDTSSKS